MSLTRRSLFALPFLGSFRASPKEIKKIYWGGLSIQGKDTAYVPEDRILLGVKYLVRELKKPTTLRGLTQPILYDKVPEDFKEWKPGIYVKRGFYGFYLKPETVQYYNFYGTKSIDFWSIIIKGDLVKWV